MVFQDVDAICINEIQASFEFCLFLSFFLVLLFSIINDRSERLSIEKS